MSPKDSGGLPKAEAILQDVLAEADVASGNVLDATEEQRGQAVAALVNRAFEAGHTGDRDARTALCQAGRALVRGTGIDAYTLALRGVGVTDPDTATDVEVSAAVADFAGVLARAMQLAGRLDVAALFTQAADRLATPPNPFGPGA